MLYTDDGRFRHLRVTDGEVLEVDRGYPFAPGLDDILGAVGDLHVTVLIDGRDIAGVEESFLVEDGVVLFVIRSRDGGAAHSESAKSLAVPGQSLTGIVGNLHLDHERRLTLLLLNIEPRIAAERGIFRLERACGSEWAHLGHAPGV